jgi:hypothetical protein
LRRAALQRCGYCRLKLAELGRPVKMMLGGLTGWEDEGLPFAMNLFHVHEIFSFAADGSA